MRPLLAIAFLFASGCMYPIHQYALNVPQSADPVAELARAFVAAGAEPDVVDPSLAFVSSVWTAPFGNDWQRRFVGVVDRGGGVTLRTEVRWCRPLEPCAPMELASKEDLNALDKFAANVGRNLGAQLTVLPAAP